MDAGLMSANADDRLAKHLAVLDARIERLTKEIDGLRADIRCLEARRDEAQSMRRKLVEVPDPDPESLWIPVSPLNQVASHSTANAESDSSTTQKPSKAIKAYLADKPDGAPLKTLVEELLPLVASKSGNKKRLLYNTVYGMRDRGSLVGFSDDQGRDYVKLASSNSATGA
jgi:hypothetical protein